VPEHAGGTRSGEEERPTTFRAPNILSLIGNKASGNADVTFVNGRFVDPMRVKLPRGRSLEGSVMAGFEKERDRLDVQMNNRGGGARVSDAASTAGAPPVRQVSNR